MTTTNRERVAKAALERWLRRDPVARALTRAVRRAQAALRDVVSDEAWARYLELEEQMNARHNEIVTIAVRLALRARDQTRARPKTR